MQWHKATGGVTLLCAQGKKLLLRIVDSSFGQIKTRESIMQVNAYLSFKGNCEEAFQFYAKVFGGKIEAMTPHEGTPAESQTPQEWRKKIIHARMTIGDSVLMGGDPPPAHYHQPRGFSINIALKDANEAERIFRALAEGGSTTMPFGETFWAVRFGMCTDRFGIPWMVNVERVSASAA